MKNEESANAIVTQSNDSSFFILHSSFLEVVVKSNGAILLKHPVAVMVVTCAVVVEARIDEDVGGDVFVELESKGVFPFVFHALVAGEPIHAALPFHVFRQYPRDVYGELRTEVSVMVLAFIDTMT